MGLAARRCDCLESRPAQLQCDEKLIDSDPLPLSFIPREIFRAAPVIGKMPIHFNWLGPNRAAFLEPHAFGYSFRMKSSTRRPAFARALPAALLLAAVLSCALARAQPVSFQLKNDVPVGQKPSLTVTAISKVLEVKVSLTRDDGARFVSTHPSLLRGKSTLFALGDGKAGKAHYKGTLALTVVGEGPWSYELDFDTLIRAPMTVNYDAEHLDLPAHTLRFQQSRAAGKAEVVVIGENGEEIGTGSAVYKNEPPGTWLAVKWETSSAVKPMMIKLHAVAADGLSVSAELIPWSVAIEHEDVTFDSDSAVIRPSEAGKLDASLVKIEAAATRAERFVKVKLYVAGHTDTVGAKDKNRTLSLDRARAIAAYFRKKGLTLSIAYEGFGEEVLKVETPDGTDEPHNRRADYVLGAAGAQPPFLGAYRAVHADWKAMK